MKPSFIIGRNAVAEALRSGRTLHKVYMLKGPCTGSMIPLAAQLRDANIPIVERSRRELNEMCAGNHQGIIAETDPYSYATVEEILGRAKAKNEPPFLLILESIQDPHNLGAILRTAETAGVHGVIIGKNRSAGLTDAVAKTAAGALEYVPVAQVTNLVRTIDTLKKEGLWVACADMDGDRIYDADLKGPLALVIGGEQEGIGRLVREHCDFAVSLPMKGHITSLNASVACGIIVYEALRQRGEDHEQRSPAG